MRKYRMYVLFCIALQNNYYSRKINAEKEILPLKVKKIVIIFLYR